MSLPIKGVSVSNNIGDDGRVLVRFDLPTAYDMPRGTRSATEQHNIIKKGVQEFFENAGINMEGSGGGMSFGDRGNNAHYYFPPEGAVAVVRAYADMVQADLSMQLASTAERATSAVARLNEQAKLASKDQIRQ